MTPDIFFAASVFAFVSSITPGPNNTMLMASGLRFGMRRSVPHLLGVQLGFALLLWCVGLGLHQGMQALPGAYEAIRVAGALYLAWMAYRMALAPVNGSTAAPSDAPTAAQPPMGFVGAALFQWVNPKAWVMAVGCMSTYLPQHASPAQMLPLVLIFLVIGLPCSASWIGFGQAMRRWLQTPRRMRIFNVTMAVALVASLYPLLITTHSP